ncbi:ABC transporter permease [Speluncibacter jeojiensis]|uniref:Transport permease protein n=1 Tax=Speluncibacter jeojiensis TaxID=2710754 RepID=A0A9X4RGQ7_9ACTN|nr:ABC transporter permease [Corynebacteriales bacterium D3-21]
MTTLARTTTALARPGRDAATMLRRNLRRMIRYPSLTVMLVGMPVVFLLLFVYVFGGTLGAGLGTAADGATGRAAYVDFLAPAILVMTIASAVQGTSISVASDMTTGIIARFRTMAISRTAVLTGHVVGSVIQTLLAMAVVLAVALAVGFRPAAGIDGWLGAIGLLVAFTVSLTWLSVAFGLVAKSVETASNLPMILLLLPFLGSAFVPVDSMPTALRWFAEYQPFTPVIDTVRGLLVDRPVDGTTSVLAIAWCVAIGVGGYLWARRLFARTPVR